MSGLRVPMEPRPSARDHSDSAARKAGGTGSLAAPAAQCAIDREVISLTIPGDRLLMLIF
jgi:hypothetical protein